MKLLGIAIIRIKKRVHQEYIKGGNEAAYATYRAITGATIQEGWKKVKPWVREWGRENEDTGN